jgi:predicted dehydrogenase
MVGFNRRYSPHGQKAREFLAGRREPLVMTYRVNAGALPRDHWIHDPETGGGRIIGEGCHFVDFMQFVCGARPLSVRGTMIGRHSSGITEDQCILELRFADGSIGTLVYAAGGDKSAPKENFAAYGAGRALVIEEFVTTEFFEGGTRRQFRTGRRDKGFAAEMQQFCQEVARGGESSMAFEDIVAVTRACILATRSLRTGEEYAV